MASNDLRLMKIDSNKNKSITGKPLEHLSPVEKHSYVFTDKLFPAYVTDSVTCIHHSNNIWGKIKQIYCYEKKTDQVLNLFIVYVQLSEIK